MTAAQMIAESTATTTTIHAAWSADLATDLLVECDDSVDTDERVEFWGTTENGAEWRVHLARPEAE